MAKSTEHQIRKKIQQIREKLEERKSLSETDESEPYEDSYEAYYEKDKTGPENEDVICGKFVWNRKKSNENITDTSDGKGFSFYLARHAFDDKFKVTIKDKTNEKNKQTLGVVAGDEKLMVVVNVKTEGDKIRIISAWKTEDFSRYAKLYYDTNKNKPGFNESVSNEYVLLRRAEEPGHFFDSFTIPKVVRLTDLDSYPNSRYASLNGTRVFIQNVGTKKLCDMGARIVNMDIRHENHDPISW